MGVIEINLAAVVGAAVASMVVGFVWYGPLFGKKWMKLSGVSMKDIESKKAGMPKTYAMAFVAALVTAYVLALFVDYTEAKTIMGGAVTGFWLWLGFIATTELGSVLWEGKPKQLYLLNAAHGLVALLVMGAILAVWV